MFLVLHQCNDDLDSWFAYLIYLSPVSQTIYTCFVSYLVLNGYCFYVFEKLVNSWSGSQPQVSMNDKFWPRAIRNYAIWIYTSVWTENRTIARNRNNFTIKSCYSETTLFESALFEDPLYTKIARYYLTESEYLVCLDFSSVTHIFPTAFYLAMDNGITDEKKSLQVAYCLEFFSSELKIGGAKYPTRLLVYSLCTHLRLSEDFFIFFKWLKQ